jgi:hypothetical protein
MEVERTQDGIRDQIKSDINVFKSDLITIDYNKLNPVIYSNTCWPGDGLKMMSYIMLFSYLVGYICVPLGRSDQEPMSYKKFVHVRVLYMDFLSCYTDSYPANFSHIS